ncbi:Syntaxin N-terminal domain [Arabidopsis suecica]|uniref:Syntaxin N-terminal domain n=1 Tax=Arabidopsis suecica TaxID=45249 RepID=A0A8T2CQ16_ARASU|nr:Syntaxin N-terminal domain [Arabidopsis suecica]
MVRSNDVKFQVYDAELTHFNLESNNNLHYNLTLNLSIRNSKSSIGIHYDRFVANVYYMNQWLGAVPMPSFYLGSKNTTLLRALFEGKTPVLLDGNGRKKFEDDRNTGVYRIDVKLSINFRVMVLHLVTWPMKPIVRCHLKDLEAGKPLKPPQRNLINDKRDGTQAVASGIFQINTAVSTFHRLVNTLGTPKDTPELRNKLHKTRLHIGQLVKDTSAKLREASETNHGKDVVFIYTSEVDIGYDRSQEQRVLMESRRSNDVKFQVYDAELTHFNLESNNNLHYNLTLSLSIRNSKSSIGIQYDRFEANVYYMNQWLGAVPMPSFYLGSKNTTLLKALFEGKTPVLLDGDGRKKFEDDRNTGVYRIDVKLSINFRVMVLHLVTWPMKPIVRCHLKDLEAGKTLKPPQRNLINGKRDGTQAVASGIFQINTAVSTFQRLVNTLGTPKDTPELPDKLFFITLALFVCFASLIVWIMLRSNAVKFQIHKAQLTQFNLDIENNNLNYNLSLNFSIRNSKNSLGIHYDRFEAMVYYSDQRLGAVSVPSFYQGHKNTTVLVALFQGQSLVLLDRNGRKKFEDDWKIGVYRLDVKLKISFRVMILHLVTWPMKPIVRCHLKVPLSSSISPGGFDFQSTKCHVAF